MHRFRIVAVFLLLFGVGVGYFVYVSQVDDASRFSFRLGLDLSGGTLLTYRADVSGVEDGDIGDAMESLRNVIERRVNIFGVSEPVVQRETSRIGEVDEQRLIVELPGVTDVDEAVRALAEPPLLALFSPTKARSSAAPVPGNAQQRRRRGGVVFYSKRNYTAVVT